MNQGTKTKIFQYLDSHSDFFYLFLIGFFIIWVVSSVLLYLFIGILGIWGFFVARGIWSICFPEKRKSDGKNVFDAEYVMKR